jgi:hypothetical protein
VSIILLRDIAVLTTYKRHCYDFIDLKITNSTWFINHFAYIVDNTLGFLLTLYSCAVRHSTLQLKKKTSKQ